MLNGTVALNLKRNKNATNIKHDSKIDNGEDDINIKLSNLKKKNKLADFDDKPPLNFIFQNYMSKNSQNNSQASSNDKAPTRNMENTPSKIKNQPKPLSVLSPTDLIDKNFSENPIYKKGMFSKNKTSIVDDYTKSSGHYDNLKLPKKQLLSSTKLKNESLKMEVQESHNKVIQEIERLKNSSKISTSAKTKPKRYYFK